MRTPLVPFFHAIRKTHTYNHCSPNAFALNAKANMRLRTSGGIVLSPNAVVMVNLHAWLRCSSTTAVPKLCSELLSVWHRIPNATGVRGAYKIAHGSPFAMYSCTVVAPRDAMPCEASMSRTSRLAVAYAALRDICGLPTANATSAKPKSRMSAQISGQSRNSAATRWLSPHCTGPTKGSRQCTS